MMAGKANRGEFKRDRFNIPPWGPENKSQQSGQELGRREGFGLGDAFQLHFNWLPQCAAIREKCSSGLGWIKRESGGSTERRPQSSASGTCSDHTWRLCLSC